MIVFCTCNLQHAMCKKQNKDNLENVTLPNS